MKRWVLLFAAFLCFSAVASAQDEAPKVELFGGYSYLHFDAPGTLLHRRVRYLPYLPTSTEAMVPFPSIP
jgi:hypothetical protein